MKRRIQAGVWSPSCTATNTDGPTRSGAGGATRRVITPDAPSFYTRFQHGVCQP